MIMTTDIVDVQTIVLMSGSPRLVSATSECRVYQDSGGGNEVNELTHNC